jgi:hypothetical protein
LDAFVIQVAGVKRWEVWERQIEHPIWYMRDHNQPVDGLEPTLDVKLSPGDVLLVRQGDPHRATCIDPPSLHLTVGVRRASGHAFLSWLVDQATDAAAVRSPMPLAIGVDDGPDREAWVTSVIEALSAYVASRSAHDWLCCYLNERAAKREVPLAADSDPSPVLTPEVEIVVSHPLFACRRDQDRLFFGGRVVRFPLELSRAVDLLCAGRQRPWTVGRLASAAGVDTGGMLTLVEVLIREGFLSPGPAGT